MTVLQEFYKEIESLEDTASRNLIRTKDIKQMIGNYYLKKEKQQIIDAYIEASANLGDITKEAAEQYYKETYENE